MSPHLKDMVKVPYKMGNWGYFILLIGGKNHVTPFKKHGEIAL